MSAPENTMPADSPEALPDSPNTPATSEALATPTAPSVLSALELNRIRQLIWSERCLFGMVTDISFIRALSDALHSAGGSTTHERHPAFMLTVAEVLKRADETDRSQITQACGDKGIRTELWDWITHITPLAQKLITERALHLPVEKVAPHAPVRSALAELIEPEKRHR